MSKQESTKKKVGEAFGGLIVIIVFMFFFVKCMGDSGTDKCDNDTMAWAMSQPFVKRLLKSPSSADFPYAESKIVIDKKANEADKNRCYFKVSANVDSQNSFGAMIRNRYYVEMIYDKEKDNWTSRNLQIAN